jgi:succinoglycan biosynthesis protein ExoL
LKVAYFVHDLTDPAVTRRVRMLHAGGAEVVVLGFRRADTAPEMIDGAPVVDLGRTFDARLGHRARATIGAALGDHRYRQALFAADVILARTLEMLLVAQAARAICGSRAGVIYECLDIHRVMLGDGVKGRVFRFVERALMRRSQLLIVSSPAFLDAYFRTRQNLDAGQRIPSLLVENKLLELDGPALSTPRKGPRRRPWRIGWLGAIRCRRSLDILTELATRRPDLLEVSIFGRPAYSEFTDFDAQVSAAPNVTFGGSYAANDLGRLYGKVDFSWAIDFMEEGLNSSWLLPNRIYESSRFGVIPIALRGGETGRFLEAHGYGVTLDSVTDLECVLDRMTSATHAALAARQACVPLSDFIADRSDCRSLVEALGSARDRNAPEP